MNNALCAEIGYASVNHAGEELCGDHVESAKGEAGETVLVLADGLGSGVKASILSTLTAKMLATMLARGISVEDCCETIAQTLPVCSVRGVAYSTFTVIRVAENGDVELIQYDNPPVIMLRDGRSCEYPKAERNIGGKKVYRSTIRPAEGDVFIAMSDGCPHAGLGTAYNFGWRREEIAAFMEPFAGAGTAAKAMATYLVDRVNELYGGAPGDDATACAVRIRRRAPVSMLFGPPSAMGDEAKMMSLFFAKAGKHIVCGGTTSALAAKHLRKPLLAKLDFFDPEIPPIGEIEGVDLTTEGVVTVNKVVEYAKDHLASNALYRKWARGRDGASLISRALFEDATDIDFYVGRAVNPAHQNPDLPISFNIKMRLVEELSDCLRQMGKRIKVSYF